MKTIPSTIKLNDGFDIPLLGLGTWQARGEICELAVEFALTHGYNLIDTAQVYDNEKSVGNGWKNSGRARNEIYITTKVTNSNQGYDRSKKSFLKSLQLLQTDYVDLLLIHWPEINNFTLTVETWRAMVKLQEEGLCRSIGVSNFTIPLIEQLLGEIDVVPAVNQVEFHTFLYQQELLAYCQQNSIQIEAYSPIAKAKFLNNEKIQRIAEKHEKTAAQIMLAWCVNHKLVAIPKSVNQERIKENADIFFELDEEDMDTLNNLGPETRLVGGSLAPPTW